MVADIAVVIPAHNEELYLGATLASVKRAVAELGVLNLTTQTIVVDDASTDDTSGIARRFGANVVTANLRNIAAARNAGAKATTASLIVFLDADTVIPPSALLRAWSALEVGAVGGVIEPTYRLVLRICARAFSVCFGMSIAALPEADKASSCFAQGRPFILSAVLTRQSLWVRTRSSFTGCVLGLRSSAEDLSGFPTFVSGHLRDDTIAGRNGRSFSIRTPSSQLALFGRDVSGEAGMTKLCASLLRVRYHGARERCRLTRGPAPKRTFHVHDCPWAELAQS